MSSRGRWALVGQVLAALVAGTAAVISTCLVFLLLGSVLGDISTEPHGYAAIFGPMLLIPASLVGATALPFAVRREHRARGCSHRAARLSEWLRRSSSRGVTLSS